MFKVYLENPFVRPNDKHIALLHDPKFLKLLRETVLKRLSDGLQLYYNEISQDNPIEYVKTRCAYVNLIGGFLTKFVRDNSDIDVTITLKNKEDSKLLQSFFRESINFKPLNENYQYRVNFFFAVTQESYVKFKRHGVQLLTNDIFEKEVEDVFLDKNMVVVQDYLKKEKLIEYFVNPIKKSVAIIKKEILEPMRVEEKTCDKLTKIYSLLNRVGTETFIEFKKLPCELTVYEYTADNLRYKALNEDSEIHKIMVLAQSKKIEELSRFLDENGDKWMRLDLSISNLLEEGLRKKLIEYGVKF